MGSLSLGVEWDFQPHGATCSSGVAPQKQQKVQNKSEKKPSRSERGPTTSSLSMNNMVTIVSLLAVIAASYVARLGVSDPFV